jgi:uncharacterized membrane protein
MKKSKSWFRTNLGYGLVVIVPLAVVLLLLAKVVELLQKAAAAMELESALGASVAIVLAIVLVLLACVAVGAIVRTRLGTLSFKKVEQVLLQHLPGYELLGNILKGFAKDQSAYPAVMLQLHGPGSAVFGLVMEEQDNGVLVVFVPSAPALTVGSVHVVERDRVTFLETSPVELANCISQWGVGADKALGGARP